MFTVGGKHVALVTTRQGFDLLGVVHKAIGERFATTNTKHSIHTLCDRYLDAARTDFTHADVTCKQCKAKEGS